MAYFTALWKARIIEKYKREYEDEKLNSLLASNTQIPRKTTSMMQKWRLYRRDTKSRIAGKLKQLFPEDSSVSSLYYYLRRDQTFPNFVLKSIVGFLGGIALTYLCFMFFVFQLSISLIHATVMSSAIGILLTIGLAFSYRIRCLVFLLVPQLFSRVGRYTLTCYALVLILTGPATNTFKNSEVLSESMACSQEQIKTSVRQINESMKKPFNAMKDTIKLMVETIKRLTSTLDKIISRISVLVISIADVIQSSLSWLNSVGGICNKRFGTPYDYCIKAVNRGVLNCKKTFKGDLSWLCNASTAAKTACWTVRPYTSVCFIADYATTSFAATMKRKLRIFTNRMKKMFFINIETKHTYTFSSNASDSATQVAAGIVTELRNRADPLLTWLSWSSCVTSLFLLLIIFRFYTILIKAKKRAKYYQHMYETRSRFDNRYVTQELRELDLKRYREGRETILPLNRREQAKYINVTSFHLVTTEKLYLTRSMVFMTITTFKLLIHIVADYSLYWVLMTMRYHGRFQTLLPPGPSNAGVQISGYGIVADFIRSVFDALTIPLVQKVPSPVTCLPNPHPPDLQRYTQIAVLIMLLWFFSLFEPYGLRLRHVIMGHYRPERAKTRAVWLYNHILRTRGSFMKLARRKLHREYKYSDHENLTFRHWINSLLPCWYLRYIFGTLPKKPHCLLCNTLEEGNDSDTKLISCKTAKCPGMYCARCFCDIGHLCTICIKPEDYGDMSDISLERGSSDDSSDKESDDDRDHSDDILTLEKNNMHDDEREKLIKKSDTEKDNTRRKPPKEPKNRAEDEISLISSDDEPQEQNIKMNSQFQNYPYNYKTSLMNTMKNKIHFILEEDMELYNWYFKVYHQKHNIKKTDLYNFEAYDSKNKKSDTIEKRNVKLKQRWRTKSKRTARSHKWHRIIKTLSEKLRFRHFKIFQCSEHWCDCIYKFNIYNIKISGRFFQVSKINAHPKKLNKFKHRYYKFFNYKNRNIKNSMKQKSNVKELFLTGCEYSKCKNKDQKSKNKRDIDLNILGNNIESNESKKEEDSRDTNVYNKHKNVAKNKHSYHGVQKLCIFCSSCLQSNDKSSREIVKDNKCWCLKKKTNFKRRKKTLKEIKSEIVHKNRISKEEKVNARNYRLSSYLSDQSWIWQKFCKDPEKLKTVDMLCDLAKLRMAVADQQAKEDRLLKGFKKTFEKTLNERHCPSDVCICERKTNKNEKSNQTSRDSVKKKLSFVNKKFSCKYRANTMTSTTKAKKIQNIDHDSLPKECSKTYSREADIARRLNFYTSLGNHDFKAIGEVPEAGTPSPTASPTELNNLSIEMTIPSNIASSSKTKSSKHSYCRIFDNMDWLKIKDIKLAISERFLLLRIKNPLPMMKELYATLLEKSHASTKVKKGKNKDTKIFKETDEKGITVLPVVKSCSSQYLDVTQTLEDRTTQVKKKDVKNLPITSKSYGVRDAEVEVMVQTCTCATQYMKCKDKMCSCMTVDKDAKETKEFGDTAKIEDYSSNETESSVTLSTISWSEDTRTDTTVCSRVTIDYEVSPRRAKPKKNIRKVKVVTKSNQGTSTDRTQLCDVSTITSDWWSPIVERKLGKEHLGRGEMYDSRKQRKKFYKDRGVSTDGRIVTFMSRAQIIPTDTGDILSPSRYLLESQKYYNELFTSRFSPRVYPVNIKGLKDCKKHWSSKESHRKDRKTKRLNRKNSPRLKISKSSIDKIRSDKSNSRRRYMKSRS